MCGRDRESLVCEGSVDVFVCVLQHMCRIMCWYDKETVRNSDGIKGVRGFAFSCSCENQAWSHI